MYDEIKDLGLELDFTTPATDKDIEEFENKLSITLGEQYKTFLKEFGTLDILKIIKVYQALLVLH